MGNTDTFSGTRFGWFYPLPTYLLALQDTPLIASLKARRCEGLLHNLAFMLSRAFFAGERLRDGELPEDSSSSARVSTSSGIMGSFPLLWANV